jgi:hypothetical protein
MFCRVYLSQAFLDQFIQRVLHTFLFFLAAVVYIPLSSYILDGQSATQFFASVVREMRKKVWLWSFQRWDCLS